MTTSLRVAAPFHGPTQPIRPPAHIAAGLARAAATMKPPVSLIAAPHPATVSKEA